MLTTFATGSVELTDDTTVAVVIDGRTTPFVDVTGATMLQELSHDLERTGITLMLAHEVGQVRDVLHQVDKVGATGQVYPTVRQAVAAAHDLVTRAGQRQDEDRP